MRSTNDKIKDFVILILVVFMVNTLIKQFDSFWVGVGVGVLYYLAIITVSSIIWTLADRRQRWYVHLGGRNDRHVLFGPYPTEKAAKEAMENDDVIDRYFSSPEQDIVGMHVEKIRRRDFPGNVVLIAVSRSKVA